jgi:hypothetical protein
MKILQYAHFDVASDIYSPDQITAELLVEPTRVSWRGTRSTEPLIPRTNLWRYRAKGTGTVDELVRELLAVFEPLAEQLARLTANDDSWLGVRFMRSFGDPDGIEEDEGPGDLPDHLVRVSGQHQLVGFHLDVDLMARLVALRCALDFDEYA